MIPLEAMIDAGNNQYFISEPIWAESTRWSYRICDTRIRQYLHYQKWRHIWYRDSKSLHSLISLLLLKHVYLPDGKTTIGMISAEGNSRTTMRSARQRSRIRVRIIVVISSKARWLILHELHQIGKQSILPHQNFNGRTSLSSATLARTGTAFLAAQDS